MKKTLATASLFIFIVFVCSANFAQDTGINFTLFPSGLLFQPPRANFEEPRLGLIYYPENKHLKVDIGNSVDLIGAEIPNSNWKMAAGIDFFAYAWSKNISGNRLQITAIDGFFGGHISAVSRIKNDIYTWRFRFIHNSSHLVDGNWDYKKKEWRDNYEPIPFTRDFAELMYSSTTDLNLVHFRYYASASYTTLVRPKTLQRPGFNAGFEFNSKAIFTPK